MIDEPLAASTCEPEIILDISRLLSRVLHLTPTGVDRVELAYAEELLRAVPDRLTFCVVHPTGYYGRIPGDRARAFLAEVRASWSGYAWQSQPRLRRRLRALKTLWTMRPRSVPKARKPRILVQSSPHHLHKEALVRDILRRENAQFVCLIHDLIPIEYPEYARPGGASRHLERIQTVARLASATLANSHATLQSFRPHLRTEKRDIPLAVAHLGLEVSPMAEAGTASKAERAEPYFVCLGTIEARKNHLLLLNIWRQLAERTGKKPIPCLIIIGRRGWENEQVVDMLERCPALKDCVEEYTGLSDREVRDFLASARAVLMPSFAEGFGMPVAEALALGTPVICSDLPSLREAGREAPDYLDPLDGIGWHNAIIEYSAASSTRRAAQIARIASWKAPSWREHLRIVLKTIEEIA